MDESSLLRAVQRFPTLKALHQGNSSLTFSQLEQQSKTYSYALLQRGVKPGEIVALADLPPLEMVTMLWACWFSQIVTFPLNVRYPATTLAEILDQIKPTLVVSKTKHPNHASISPQELAVAPGGEPPDGSHWKNTLPATILMTSGSSGRSKFVQHSFRNHIANAVASHQNIPLSSGDKWVLALPLYHIGGLSLLFRTSLASAELVIPDDKQGLLKAIKTNQATHISLVAAQLQRLLVDPEGPGILKNLKAILLGGSALPQELIQEALDLGLPIHVSYGSTEMSSQITTTSAEDRKSALTSSGKPLPGTDLLISHEGEILVRGETLAMGYRKGSEIIRLTDEAGWYHTGDVGYLNVHGSLTVTGRMDNQFISGGENIQPEHIERILGQIPGISQAVVIPQTDKDFGARPVAFLALSDNFQSVDEINSRLRDQLPGFMIPVAYYHLSDELRGEALKISRKTLQEFLHTGNKALHSL